MKGIMLSCRLQTTQPTSGGAVTVVSSCCANCVELTAITGPLSYVVHLDDGRTQRYHIHQLRARHSNAPQTEINIPGNVFVPTIPDNVTSASKETTPVAPVLNREPIAYTHVATAITETSRHTAGVQYERLIIYIDNQSHY